MTNDITEELLEGHEHTQIGHLNLSGWDVEGAEKVSLDSILNLKMLLLLSCFSRVQLCVTP